VYSTEQNKPQRTVHILTRALTHTHNSSSNDNNDNDDKNNNGDKAQKTSDVKMQHRKTMNGNKQQHTQLLQETNHKEETQQEHHNKSCWSLHMAFQKIKQSKHITPKTQDKTME